MADPFAAIEEACKCPESAEECLRDCPFCEGTEDYSLSESEGASSVQNTGIFMCSFPENEDPPEVFQTPPEEGLSQEPRTDEYVEDSMDKMVDLGIDTSQADKVGLAEELGKSPAKGMNTTSLGQSLSLNDWVDTEMGVTENLRSLSVGDTEMGKNEDATTKFPSDTEMAENVNVFTTPIQTISPIASPVKPSNQVSENENVPGTPNVRSNAAHTFSPVASPVQPSNQVSKEVQNEKVSGTPNVRSNAAQTFSLTASPAKPSTQVSKEAQNEKVSATPNVQLNTIQTFSPVASHVKSCTRVSKEAQNQKVSGTRNARANASKKFSQAASPAKPCKKSSKEASRGGEGDGGHGDILQVAKEAGIQFPRPRWWGSSGGNSSFFGEV